MKKTPLLFSVLVLLSSSVFSQPFWVFCQMPASFGARQPTAYFSSLFEQDFPDGSSVFLVQNSFGEYMKSSHKQTKEVALCFFKDSKQAAEKLKNQFIAKNLEGEIKMIDTNWRY